mmetsp:Transcript_43450/g.63784  ORF Transcript_43450/g.63784 Transcript_43450/m.63784 type:complete len:236 (-) Transcript_43450:62-769(-)
MAPKIKKNLRFAPEESNDIFLIPTRIELSSLQKHAIWYKQEELDHFKKKANSMSRVLRWTNQNTDASYIKTPTVSNLKEHLKSYSSGAAFSEHDLKKICAILLYQNKHKGSSCLSWGLEFRMSHERQQHRKIAIRTILNFQSGVAKNDAMRMSFVSQRCSSWATTLALETGATDAAIVACDLNNETNFACSSSSKVSHSYNGTLCGSFCYRHRNDTITAPIYPMVTGSVKRAKVA